MFVTEGMLRQERLTSPKVANIERLLREARCMFTPELLRSDAHPLAYKFLLQHGKSCKVRTRVVDVHYADRGIDGNSNCTHNATRHALDTGMSLWSGYAYDWVGKRAYWHLWNTDFQDFVYDTTYGRMSYRFSYFGVQLNPYVAHEFIENHENHLESGIFMYWSAFEAFETGLRTHHNLSDEEIWKVLLAAYDDIKI